MTDRRSDRPHQPDAVDPVVRDDPADALAHTDASGQPDDATGNLPTGEPEDNPDDLTVQGGE